MSMRRAIPRLLAAIAIAVPVVTLDTPPTHAGAKVVMSGIGLIDYRNKPTFKVGDWVRYHMQSRSELGQSDDYTLTLLIAGEEDFWGDPGFWLETWAEVPNGAPAVRGALMSYEIFGDSLATQRLQLYQRKLLSGLNEDGSPAFTINKPATGLLKTRSDPMMPAHIDVDTLGRDTVRTPMGIFNVLKVVAREGRATTQSVGDSSVYSEVRENRTSWYAMDVPITHLAREDVEDINARKSWLIGRSGDASALNINDRALGTARMIGFGHGLEARMLPERLRHTIAEQVAAERAAARPRAATAPKRR